MRILVFRYSIFALLLFGSTLYAQQSRDISGVVLDAQTREGIFGASVFIKGTAKGTVTDINGNFSYSIQGADLNNTVLSVSYIGYKTKEIRLGDEQAFEILLSQDIEALETVVLTSSYGTKKLKEEVVGSIVSVSPEALATEQPATSIDELLEGQVAGVRIESNPALGEPVRIDIRGQGSLTPLSNNVIGTSTQPLIIVDGVILTEEIGIDGNNFFDAGEGLLSENFLNPLARVGIQDIESINVLKDAAAVGIYGANAANGVILITTKKGNLGKVRFNASVQGGYSEAYNEFNYLSGAQFNELQNLFNTNTGNTGAVSEWNGVNTNWIELLSRDAAFTRYSIGASGGFEAVRFRGSITYQKREESQQANNFDQLNSTLAADYAKGKFQASVRISPSFITKNTPNTLANFPIDPTIPVRDQNGDFTPFAFFGNPLAVAQQNKALSETFGLLGSINFNYDFNQHWKLRSIYGVNIADKDEDRFFSAANGSGRFNNGDLGRRLIRERNTFSWNWSGNLSYNNLWKERHAFEGILGVETRGEKVDFSFLNARNFSNPTQLQPIEEASSIDRRSDSSENYGRSIFSQLNYNFDKTYFLLANFRVDQSSSFGGDNNTAINAGAGASWVLSKEEFLRESPYLDFLRLRLSYGSTGNSRIGSYRALGLYVIDDEGYNGQDIANPSGDAPNPNLGWEKNYKFNLGVDFNFLQRFRASLEWFRDDIQDIIVSRNALPESGYANVQINGASMINKGIEFSISADWWQGTDFSWNTNFNIATLDNEVTALQGIGSNFSSSEVARAQTVGFPTSTIWGFESLGIDPATGRELFNVDGQTYDIAGVRANFDTTDWTPIGNSQADFYGGMRNNFRYKNFNLSVIMAYTYGADQLVSRIQVDNYNVLSNRNINVNTFYDAWRQAGDVALYPAVDITPVIFNSSRYVYDTSNIQLKSVSLTYDLPVDSWKLPLKSLSINANGSNLYYWFKEKSPDGRNGIAEFRNSTPQLRTFSLGLNTTF